jgi:hypothetical protein
MDWAFVFDVLQLTGDRILDVNKGLSWMVGLGFNFRCFSARAGHRTLAQIFFVEASFVVRDEMIMIEAVPEKSVSES